MNENTYLAIHSCHRRVLVGSGCKSVAISLRQPVSNDYYMEAKPTYRSFGNIDWISLCIFLRDSMTALLGSDQWSL